LKIDEIDLSILQALQQNSRLSLRELGKQINLSPPSVAERVRQLESFGVIKRYTIDIDYEKLHLPVSSDLFLSIPMLYSVNASPGKPALLQSFSFLTCTYSNNLLTKLHLMQKRFHTSPFLTWRCLLHY
jgi:DNA-binding Lrp family transcriptional regulator